VFGCILPILVVPHFCYKLVYQWTDVVYAKSELFWEFAQHRMVRYRRFGTTYWHHHQ